MYKITFYLFRSHIPEPVYSQALHSNLQGSSCCYGFLCRIYVTAFPRSCFYHPCSRSIHTYKGNLHLFPSWRPSSWAVEASGKPLREKLPERLQRNWSHLSYSFNPPLSFDPNNAVLNLLLQQAGTWQTEAGCVKGVTYQLNTDYTAELLYCCVEEICGNYYDSPGYCIAIDRKCPTGTSSM